MPYPKRTRKQTLLRLKKLWETMRDNFNSSKADAYWTLNWPLTSDSGLCPACTYNFTHSERYCNDRCILPWTGGGGCLEHIDEYSVWRRNPTPENADAIVKLCDKALEGEQ